VADHPFRDTANEPSSDADLTMAGHGDETSRNILGGFDDFRGSAIDSTFNDFG
jgi:hypothetical protein